MGDSPYLRLVRWLETEPAQPKPGRPRGQLCGPLGPAARPAFLGPDVRPALGLLLGKGEGWGRGGGGLLPGLAGPLEEPDSRALGEGA